LEAKYIHSLGIVVEFILEICCKVKPFWSFKLVIWIGFHPATGDATEINTLVYIILLKNGVSNEAGQFQGVSVKVLQKWRLIGNLGPGSARVVDCLGGVAWRRELNAVFR